VARQPEIENAVEDRLKTNGKDGQIGRVPQRKTSNGTEENQLLLDVSEAVRSAPVDEANSNVIQSQDSPVHGWYRFVLSYPPHLVRKYIEKFELTAESLLLDPFCGTGTTLVEAKLLGIPSLGCDAHPFAVLASRVKTNWSPSVRALRAVLSDVVDTAVNPPLQTDHSKEDTARVTEILTEFGFPAEQAKLIPEGFVSATPA
jgi:hypothetical protein